MVIKGYRDDTLSFYPPQKFENNVYKRVSLMVTCEHGFGQFLWGMLEAAQAVFSVYVSVWSYKKTRAATMKLLKPEKTGGYKIWVYRTVTSLCLFVLITGLRDTDALNETSAVSSVKVWTLFWTEPWSVSLKIPVGTQQLWGETAAVTSVASGLKYEAFHNCTVYKITFKWRLTIL